MTEIHSQIRTFIYNAARGTSPMLAQANMTEFIHFIETNPLDHSKMKNYMLACAVTLRAG